MGVTTSLPAITVEGVWKRYPRNEVRQHTLRTEAVSMFKAMLRRQQSDIPDEQAFYALRDVSFTVGQGEALALVGRNGSGKTTLLRILAGITRPTRGSVRVRGNYVSLIALGAGFKPDLNGRENIIFNAAIHGKYFSHNDPVVRDIIEFSELGDFINLPISRYSSGMGARLAFSIAVHILPEVIFIDEVLAVGDASFQQKCMERITELRQSGRTIVFVSHDSGAVRTLCQRAVWLHGGCKMLEGPTSEVLAAYEQHLAVNPTIAKPSSGI
jgi:lipopolysaccharide transport system ATP-binding protein